jgi:3-oxoacyl-[acyl-carrier protein] reductase
MPRLAGKRALVTGGGGGLGAAIARRFRDEGAEVLVNDVREDAARATAEELGCRALVADVADSRAVREMFEQAGGPLDVLVNNAGIGGSEHDPERARLRIERNLRQAEEAAAGGPITTHTDVTVEMSDEDWQQMLAVHLNGTFYCSREALKIMNPQGSGCIVNLGSIMGTAGGAGAPHYCARQKPAFSVSRARSPERSSPATSG